MKNKFFLLAAMAMLLSPVGLFAQEKTQTPTKFKFYGFFRNFTALDTRDSYAGTQDLFYFAPKDVAMSADGVDLNAKPSFRSLALTSRLGLDYSGYQYGATKVSGKIEADFYSMNSSTAVFRMRQAYVDFSWADLGKDNKSTASLRVGQAWHPLAVDLPLVIDLESGSPFAPFSRTPQIMGNYNLNKNVTFTAGFIFQMQYLSTGPNGTSTDYLKYGLLPEIYAGVTVKNNSGLLAKAGLDILSIKPRVVNELNKVNDRITTVNPFVYVQYTDGLFQLKAKSTLASAGEHLNFRSGYGVSKIHTDGSREYTPMRSTATFVSASYGKKWQVMGMVGYLKQLGTAQELAYPATYYWCSNSAYKNLNQMVRFTPTLQYTAGKIQVALEYNFTTAQYGSSISFGNRGLCTEDLHWVSNHRILTMVKFNF